MSSHAQVLRDKYWLHGGAGLAIMRFEQDTIIKSYFEDANNTHPVIIQYYKRGHSCISDSSGDYQFSSDGMNIHTREYNLMEGGHKIVPDKFYNDLYGVGYYSQSSIILPLSGKKYMVVHTALSDNMFDTWERASNNDSIFYDNLWYALVDMEANGGLGKVESSRNVLVENGYMSKPGMTACRHANGRDWWLLKGTYNSIGFYTFLIKADGSSVDYGIQWFPRIGQDYDWDGDGQTMFSADGSLLATVVEHRNMVNLFDFDRCAGLLSNQRAYDVPRHTVSTHIDTADYEFSTTVSVCFSPNKRFLYVGNMWNIQQLDLWESDSVKAWYHVAKLDTTWEASQGYSNIFPAPNGALYIGNWNGLSKQMSRIDHPDAKGAACGFCPRCERFNFAWGAATSPPNMSNYRLGPLSGSPCDSLAPPPLVPYEEFILPNAFSPNGDGHNDTWHILNSGQLVNSGTTLQAIEVYNRWGNEVFKSGDMHFGWDAKGLASDTYHYYIRYRNKDGFSKIVKGSVLVIR